MKIGNKSKFIGRKCQYNGSIGIIIGEHRYRKNSFIMAVLDGTNGWKNLDHYDSNKYYKIYSHKNNEKGYWYVRINDIINEKNK